MADYRLCSIPECGRTHKSNSYCNMHYLRLRRHGDPLKTVKTPNGEASSFYQEVVLQYDGYECLTWPYACNADGYGMVWRDGKLNNVHRLLCEAIHGPPPTPDHQAAHSCGNGGLGCSTKRHLSWKTRIQNKEDGQ